MSQSLKTSMIFIFGCSVWSLCACKTGEKVVTSTFVDGENPSIKMNEGEDEDVPAFMWSPSQRKAAAGHHFLIGEYMSLSGDVPNASQFYKSSYDLDPNPFLAAKLIRSHAGIGQLDTALPEAKKMVLLYPKSSELRLLYGQLLARKGIYYNAVKELEKSLEIGPPSELAYKELIALHLANNLSKRALIVAESYTKAFTSSAEAWSKLSQILFSAGKNKKALGPARRAYELQSVNPEYALLYAIVSEMTGDRKKAVALYEQLYRLDPGNEELIARMISLYKNMGDLSDALELLGELSKISKNDNPGIDIQRAFILWELNRFKEASLLLEELSNRFPKAERLRYMKALGYEKTERFDEAIVIYRSFNKGDSFYVESQFRLLVTLKGMKKLKEAEQVFDTMASHEGVTWEYFVIGAGVKSELGRNVEAAESLKVGYGKFPKQTRLLFLAGVYYEKNKDIDKTIEVMKEVIKQDSTYSTAYNFLGYLYAEQGEKLDEAEKLVLKALELKPNDGYYLDSLGWVYFQKKEFNKAKKYLEQSLKLLPDEGVVLEHLSDVYFELGNTEKAYQLLKKATQVKLEERDEQRIKDKFEQMKKSRGAVN